VEPYKLAALPELTSTTIAGSAVDCRRAPQYTREPAVVAVPIHVLSFASIGVALT
jgi:hypothetical protein